MDRVLLPYIDPSAVERLTKALRKQSWSQRPAEATARVLTLIVELWEERIPFPTRGVVATHAGVSVPTVDIVLRRQHQGQLLILYDHDGRSRWIVPADDIIAVAKGAKLLLSAVPAENVPGDRGERRQRRFPADLVVSA
jgi:hypothetical protein